MQLIRGLINLNHQADFCIATIGNFDGVHLGHQAIIKKVIQYAEETGHQSCVILFEPHPKEVFMRDDCPARISNFSEKYRLLKELGVDKLLVLKFNRTLSHMPAKEFIQNVLIEQLRIKHLVVGDDFQFGYKRQGNFQLLQECGQENYTVEPTTTVMVKKDSGSLFRVSSTLVRDELKSHNFSFIEKILSRRYAISGRVGYGQQLGRQIGFPTANVNLKRRKPPVLGVVLVKGTWQQIDDEGLTKSVSYWGVANCGSRPTIQGQNYRLEVHLLGVSPNLYGIELKVDFYAFIRDEKKFENVQDLKQQIEIDVKQAKKLITGFK